MDLESRRRWFRSHPAAHYALAVVVGLIVWVALARIFVGFSWPDVLYRAASGVILGVFTTWLGRRRAY